jgi:hypothetical protein
MKYKKPKSTQSSKNESSLSRLENMLNSPSTEKTFDSEIEELHYMNTRILNLMEKVIRRLR